MEIKEKVKLKITDMSAEGNGIGRTEEGLTVFVSGAVLGDVVEAEITKIKKNYALADCSLILERSPYRQDRYCKWQDVCGGCGLGELSYETQTKLKEEQVRNKLKRIGGIGDPNLKPIVVAEEKEVFNYRNKAVMAVGEDFEGNPIIGFREREKGRIIDCDQCMLQAPPAKAVAKVIRDYMRENHVPAYDRKNNSGLLRHVIVKTSFDTGEVMVVLVINGKNLPEEESLITALDEAVVGDYSLESVAVNINKNPGGEILSEKTLILAGKGSIDDGLCGLKFQVSPMSFYQVNPTMAEKLYEKVMEYGAIGHDSKVLDLYCGVGTLGLIAASRGAKSVVGVEEISGAILDANRNAVINGIVNAVFYTGKAEDVLVEDGSLTEGLNGNSFDTIIMDPPRKGCDGRVLEFIGKSGANRLVYVSCDPATQARDIKALAEYGFRMEEATPFDMFPNTTEVENICLLRR